MGKYASGKYALAISDRSGMAFPYDEMVREWNGSLVHYSEFEAKQPQLDPKPVGSDPQGLYNPRPQPASKTSLTLLGPNPFEAIISTVPATTGQTYINVFSEDHQRSAGDIVRFRGNPQVTSAGPGGSDPADAKNLQAFATINFSPIGSNLSASNGYTIALGKIDAAGNVTGATTTDPLTNPINYFHVLLGGVLPTAISGTVGGGENNSAGPVTLEVIN
jgi:hypothetical protein